MKILIVKIGAIGDVVMMLPILTHIKTLHPNAHITWIAGKQVESLLNATHLIDHIYTLDEKALFKGSFVTRLKILSKLWLQLLPQKFDLCLTLHPDPRYRWISFPLRCKEKRSWTRKGSKIAPIPGRYHAEEAIRLFTNQASIQNQTIHFPKIHLSSLKIIDAEKPIVVIAPGGAKNILADDDLRRWPIAYYAKLMQELSLHPVHLAITGAASDEWVLPHLPSIPHTNLIGKLDVLELLRLLQQSKLLITHDSGPLHLAKLVHSPTIALFGPTNPFEKTSPQEKIKVLWGGEHLVCRPCYNGKTYAACTNNLCLQKITPEMVLQETLQFLALRLK